MMAQFGTEPVEVAKKIADILEDENPLPRYTVVLMLQCLMKQSEARLTLNLKIM